MPNYTFYDPQNQKQWTDTMSIAEMESFLQTHPHVQWVPTAGLPTLDSVRLGVRKPDEGFRDVLRTIKKGSPKSTVNTF